MITDNLNPVFVKSVPIRYLFEERQEIKISVFDIDDFKEEVSIEQNLIGSVELCLHEIVTSPNGKLVRTLKNATNESNLGELEIVGEERKKGPSAIYKMKFLAEGFNYEYIFYRIYRLGTNNDFLPIIESETSKKPKSSNTHNFNEIELSSSALFSDDSSRKIRLEVFQWNSSGKHISLGKKELLISDLMNKTELKFAENQVFKTVLCEQHVTHTFLDYILNGLEIALVLAIDFTGSNGSPNEPSSLHYFDMAQNQYLQAILNVGHILENYDSDKKFSALGFGAASPGFMTTTSHCFAINGNIFAPEIPTLQGVCEGYKNVLKHLEFSGPTNFASIINYINRMIEFETISQKQNKYYILLIMTDGKIDDLQETIDEIVRATSLPLSIIIVGVGSSNFDSMEVLDADEKPLYSNKLKKFMERDIVQFVPFAEYKHDPVKLAKETLEEVPRQLVSYMRSKGISPIQQPIPHDGEKTNFFDEDKRLFVQTLLGMGYTKDRIDMILNKGIPSADISLFLNHVEKGANYQNPMTFK